MSSKILAFDNLYSDIHFTHASLDALRLSFHYQAKRAGSQNHLQVNSVTRKFPGVVGQLACGGSLFHEGLREGDIWNGMGQQQKKEKKKKTGKTEVFYAINHT